MASEREEVPSDALDPAPPAAPRLGKWIGWLVAANLAGFLWLAVREESPASLRELLDHFWRLAQGGVVAYAAYRLLIQFPFRILDLMVIVMLLSLGLMGTLEMMRILSYVSILTADPITFRENLGAQLQGCLLGSSLLLAGAALGLRYCARLDLDAASARIWAITMGTLALPAATGFMALPAIFLVVLADSKASANEPAVVALAWFVCGALVAVNALYLVRSMALKSEVDPAA